MNLVPDKDVSLNLSLNLNSGKGFELELRKCPSDEFDDWIYLLANSNRNTKLNFEMPTQKRSILTK